MKRIIICLWLSFGPLISFAAPQLNSFNVLSNYLQDGKIKVTDNGTSQFVASITSTRANTSSGYESVQMEITVFAELAGITKDLKVINIATSDYDGPFLKSGYQVTVQIPTELKNAQIRVKYRYKDSSGAWVPNYSPGFLSTNINYYTINITPLADPIPFFLISYKNIKFGFNDVFKLSSNENFPINSFDGHTSGRQFLAYSTAASIEKAGAISIYEHKFRIYDLNGNLIQDGSEIFFYTINAIEPPPAAPSGFTYKHSSSNIAFYAFNVNRPGTIPVYHCVHRSVPNMQLYRVNRDNINEDLWDVRQIAFYAYPVPMPH